MNNITIIKNILLQIIIVCCFSVIIYAQKFDSLQTSNLYPIIVDSILIFGNNTTEEFIITRELTFSKGDTLDQAKAFYNRERIYSLGIFNQVYVIPEIIDDKNLVKIIVEEGWYIYPIPFVDIKEDDFDKITYGIFFRWKNFRGRNEDLTASAAFGYDPAFFINYYNPNLIGNENFFLRFNTGFATITNKSPIAEELYGQSFEQDFVVAQITFGKRFGLFNRLAFSVGYNNIETPFYIPGVNASDDRIDNLLIAGLGYQHDTRDLAQFPKNGIYSNIDFSVKGFGIDNVSYAVGYLDFREYRKVFERLISKWRIASRMTFGDAPHYDESILGLQDKIRGHYFDKYEADDYYLGSLELYYPIIEEIDLDLTFIPIIPDQLLSYRLGFFLQVFAETGLAKNKSEPFMINNLVSGYGIGISFLFLPYQVFRAEVGIDEYQNVEFIIGLGISF